MKYSTGLRFKYPDKVDGHMIDPKQVRNVDLNEGYPYYNKRFWFSVGRYFFHCLILCLAFPCCFIRFGLKIKGKEYTKGKWKETVRKGGLVTTCNHVLDWDYLFVRLAMRPRMGYYVIWWNNHNCNLGKAMRLFGSVPIPRKLGGLSSFRSSIGDILKDGKWVHVYPEGSEWFYYQSLRPFKKGTFTFAVDSGVPVMPMAISFRPATGLYRLWKRHGYPLATITMSEPQYPDESLERNERVKELQSRVESITKKLIDDNTPDISEEYQQKLYKRLGNKVPTKH